MGWSGEGREGMMSLTSQLCRWGMNGYCSDTRLLSKHHSLTVEEEMVIFPTLMKMGRGPGNPR